MLKAVRFIALAVLMLVAAVLVYGFLFILSVIVLAITMVNIAVEGYIDVVFEEDSKP